MVVAFLLISRQQVNEMLMSMTGFGEFTKYTDFVRERHFVLFFQDLDSKDATSLSAVLPILFALDVH